MSRSRRPHPGVAAIVERIPGDQASAEIAAAFRAQIPAFERLSAASQQDIVEGVRRNLARWRRWVATGVAPPDDDFEPLRDWVRARATEGVRLEDLLRAFGVGGRLGWEQVRRHARDDEAPLLIEAAGLLLRYLDRMTTLVVDTYLAERDVLVSEEERRTRTLIDRLVSGAPLEAADLDLAERLGVPVAGSYVPFAVVVAGQTARHHAALAARLRRRGWRLATTEGDRVAGLVWTPLGLSDLSEGADALLVLGEPTPRAELGAARSDLALLAAQGLRAGRRGLMRAEDHVVEMLLASAPRLAARLRSRIVGALDDPDHEELLRTLRALVACRLDRADTSAALGVHRNTLAYRLGRIEQITGLDLGSPRDLARVYLAFTAEGV